MWINIGDIVVQEIKDEVTLMFMRPNDLALTGIWLAISVMEVIPFFNPKYLGECLELMVLICVSSFCPSIEPWMISSSILKYLKMGSFAISLVIISFPFLRFSRKTKLRAVLIIS